MPLHHLHSRKLSFQAAVLAGVAVLARAPSITRAFTRDSTIEDFETAVALSLSAAERELQPRTLRASIGAALADAAGVVARTVIWPFVALWRRLFGSTRRRSPFSRAVVPTSRSSSRSLRVETTAA